jgi:hypothetical protein
MKPAKLTIPRDIGELLEHLTWMLLKAPKFLDKTGYFPFQDVEQVFRELNEGLGNVRPTLGEERYRVLSHMSDQMRAYFEADPENKTGETRKGRDIIYEMEKILKEARRKS